MQCSATLRLPQALRAATCTRRAARRVALRAVAFRTDSPSTPSTPTPTADLVTAKTTEITDALTAKAAETAAILQAKWEDSDNKPAIVATGVAALFALYITNTVVSTIDRLPVIHSLFELLGLGVFTWFAFRWFFVAGEREAITAEVKGFANDIGLDL